MHQRNLGRKRVTIIPRSPLESRTTPFEQQPVVSDFTKELIDNSGYSFEVKEESASADSQFLTLHCKSKTSDSQHKIVYTARAYPRKKEIILYTSYHHGKDTLATIWEDTFSYKASVKMHDVHPWINQVRDAHDTRAKKVGGSGTVAKIGLSFAMPIIWSRLKWALDVQHEKKSKSKDKSDATLFNTDLH